MTGVDKEEIRKLTPNETPLLRCRLEELADYHNRVADSFTGIYPTMPVDLHLGHMRDHIINETALIVGLFLPGGELGGFGMASFEGEYGEVDYLFVKEELRGKGRGKRLLEALLAYLGENAVTLVDLRVVIGSPAKAFYEKRGFAPRMEVLTLQI